MSMEPKMQDSGERRTFETGAVRDRGEFKPRPDLISPHANLREGAWLALGAKKYKPRNWEKGMNISECVASLSRHLEAYKLGLTDEDHIAAIRTNAGFILHYEEEIKAGRLPASLDDMPKYENRPMLTPAACSDDANMLRCKKLLERIDTPIAKDVDSDEAVQRRVELQARWRRGELLSDRENEELHAGPLPGDTRLVNGNTQRFMKWERRPGPETFNKDIAEPVKPFTVYLCGPITGEKVDHLWRDAATAFLRQHGIKTLDPLRGKIPDQISNLGMSYGGELASTAMADRDDGDVGISDMILAHFPYLPPRQSIGSLMEMGMAAKAKKPVLLCTGVPQFNEHLFCRRFCVIEPNFEKALNLVIDWSRNTGRNL